jgi:hypothetical protein
MFIHCAKLMVPGSTYDALSKSTLGLCTAAHNPYVHNPINREVQHQHKMALTFDPLQKEALNGARLEQPTRT